MIDYDLMKTVLTHDSLDIQPKSLDSAFARSVVPQSLALYRSMAETDADGDAGGEPASDQVSNTVKKD